jgi:DNA-binding CsgD family transcriptional regulator
VYIKMSSRFSAIDIVESAYRLEGARLPWLKGLCEAARPLLDTGLGVIAWTLDARDRRMPRLSKTVRLGGRKEFERTNARFMDALGPATGVAVYRCPAVGTASELVPMLGLTMNRWSEIAPREVKDLFSVSAQSADGLNVMLAAPLRERRRTSRRERALWSMVAAHLASSFRLRIALEEVGPSALDAQAILRPSGICEHAEPAAQSNSIRAALRDAAIAIDRARTRAPESEAEALLHWPPLIAAHWSLLDRFERDGRHYLIAVNNAPRVGDPRVLSPREQQVVAHALLGHSVKLVAYELGLSSKTVSFHLQRAYLKLGVRNRLELLSRTARLIPPGASARTLSSSDETPSRVGPDK